MPSPFFHRLSSRLAPTLAAALALAVALAPHRTAAQEPPESPSSSSPSSSSPSSSSPAAPAPDDSSMPLEIFERGWKEPGPTQSAPGAPKVLLVYPLERTHVAYIDKATRYAGRVDPPDAALTLDGEEVKVWPGGVFTGLLRPSSAGERTYAFKASAKGKSTSIKRTVILEPRVKPPTAWPLAFHAASPVLPEGEREYWLRAGSKLEVKLLASPGHSASARVGEGGPWLPMRSGVATAEQGGAYLIEIPVDAKTPTELQPIEFKLTGAKEEGGKTQTIAITSKLRLKRLPDDAKLTGRVVKEFATFLKRDTGWERHGNWDQGAPFPVVERRGDRFKVDFGAGEIGYVEQENVALDEPGKTLSRPDLPEPMARFLGPEGGPVDRIEIDWDCPHALACVFEAAPDGDGTRLTVRLLGAASAKPAKFDSPKGKWIASARVLAAGEGQPPRAEITLEGRELWGYGWSEPMPGKRRLTVRARPSPKGATEKKPLAGIKIMVDAGHGGSDAGALGPSGLAEADLNLVMAAHLGRRLRELGAEVRQCRVDDRKVELDARVDQALAFGADLFISCHHNSVGMNDNPLNDKGPIVFYHYADSRELAQAVSSRLIDLLLEGRAPRVTPQNFRVNRNLSVCPSILIEGGFVCHPEDEVKLRRTETLKKMAESTAAGVVAILGRP